MSTSSENMNTEMDAEDTTASQEAVVTLDGVRYSIDQLSETARQTLASIRFCDEAIQQRQNELAIADTARRAYGAALKRELAKVTDNTE